MIKKLLLITASVLAIAFSTHLYANEVSGPSPVLINETHTYQLDNEFESFYLAPSWEVTGGTVQSTWQSGYDYFVSIEWTTVGTGTVEFKNGSSVVDSYSVTVNACAAPSAGSIGSAQTICYNTTPAPLTNVTSASGGDGNIAYKWQYKDEGASSWTGISNSNSATYSPPGGLTVNRYYRRRARSCDQNRFSNTILISVHDDLDPGSVTNITQTLCFGEDAPMMTTNTLPSGGDGGYSYQWQERVAGGSWNNISGATSHSFDPSNLTAITEYRRATIVSCQTKYSNVVTANVYPDLDPGTIGNPQEMCFAQGDPASLSNVSAASGGNGTIAYQWEKKNTQGQWVEIANETGLTFTPPVATGTVEYRRRASSCIQDKYSNEISVTIHPPLFLIDITYPGSDVSFGEIPPMLDGDTPTGGNGTIDYQWEKRLTTETEFTPITGEISEDYSPGNLIESAVYRRVTSSCDETRTSNEVSIAVYMPNIQSSIGSSMLMGESTVLSVPNVSSVSYQWYKNGNPIDGETTHTLVVNFPGTYRVTINTPAGTQYSTNFTLEDGAEEQNQNLVKVRSFRVPVSDEGELESFGDALDQITFYDAIGRTEQVVQVSQSPTNQDLIQPMEYDQYGRQTKSYRPYVEGYGGIHKDNSIASQRTYYLNSLHASDYAYTETFYDRSPLNRVLRQGNYGEEWRLNGGHDTSYDYQVNETDEVRYFRNETLITGSADYYITRDLYKNSITDEDGNQTIEFTNKQGQTVLKKSQVNATTWAETYYIYDIYGQLTVVLPPEASSRLDTDFYGQTELARKGFLNTWAFLYDYDGRNRMTMKKVPGADTVFMVYDKWDRLVLTQDGVQRESNAWLFTKYDHLNRPIITGLMNGASESAERSAVAANSDRYESFLSTGVNEYTDVAYPPNNQVDQYLTVTYYDHYDWDTTGLAFTYPSGLTFNPAVKGQVTGTLTSIGDGAFIKSASYYDDKYRVIQSQSTNHLEGKDIVTNYYDFIGQVTQSVSTHNDGTTTTNISRRYEYDHVGRLLKTYHQINDEEEVLVASNSYNELGELVEKDLHGGTGGTFVQSLDYTYNIRGWLTSINGSDLSTSSDGDLFGMELFYESSDPSDDLLNPKYYNGNIGAMKWSTYNDGEWADTEERGYRFTYDGLNRLEDANGNLNRAGSWNETQDYRGQYSYDLNGNIQTLTRRNMKGNLIDDLTYDYTNGGNQLQGVSDAADSIGFYDGNTSGDDYVYDANGNMVKDRNKAIDTIHYNHLNLPVKVILSNSEGSQDSITYWYDAAGIKLQQKVYQGGSLTKTTDYVGEFIYENDTLELIQHEEGRIVPVIASGSAAISSFDYQYHLKDHLGNVRLTFSTTPESYTMVETFETGEENGWQDLHRHTHTNANTTIGGDEVERLQSGETGAMVFLSVNKRDTVNLSVQANYENAPTGNTFLGTAYNALFNSFDNVYGGTEGVTSTSSDFNDALSGTDMAGKSGSTAAPRAFLNYIFFDEDMNYVNAGFTQISTAAQGAGVHETILLDVPVANREGYVLAYLSNENQEAVNIHWDDFTVYHGKTNVVSTQDYYPFGLTFNESVRVASTENNFLFNQGTGEKTFLTERISDLGLNWDMTKYRIYDYSIGRFLQVDPLADAVGQERWTPYHFVLNNPLLYSDPYGDCTDPNDPNCGQNQGFENMLNTVSGNKTSVTRSGNSIGVNITDGNGNISHSTTIKLAKSSMKSNVSDTDAKTIGEVAITAGDDNVTISSVKRNAKQQASAMFNNLEGSGPGQGVSAQRKLYNGMPGNKVIDKYVDGKNMQILGKLFGLEISSDRIKGMMTNKINELGVGNVTRHASNDPSQNVIDVAPSSVENDAKFVKAAKTHPSVIKFIPYPKDPGHHFVIDQK